MDWHDYYFKLCDTVALKSKDQSTKVGCIVVGPDHEIRSTGYNDFPRGAIDSADMKHCDKYEKHYGLRKGFFLVNKIFIRIKELVARRRDRPLKYLWTEHAERNAFYNAARSGISLNGCILYVNSLPPCCDCARGIIQTGIIEIHCNYSKIPERWNE